jgi:glycosyltransferase involved in cell wall biosynthesis
MLLSIIIPVFNEEKTIKKILDKISSLYKNLEKEIIIVDDGSTDDTRDILDKLDGKNTHVILKEKNSRKGDSLKIGFNHGKGEYVIVRDADLEYDPKDSEKLLDVIKKNPNSIFYGSRFMGSYKKMSSLHFFGNKILTFATNILYGVYLTDMETCYKLFPGKFIRNVKLNSRRFEFEPEITAKAIKSGYKIIEVPISYSGRNFSEGKKITWKDGLSAISTLIKYRFIN